MLLGSTTPILGVSWLLQDSPWYNEPLQRSHQRGQWASWAGSRTAGTCRACQASMGWHGRFREISAGNMAIWHMTNLCQSIQGSPGWPTKVSKCLLSLKIWAPVVLMLYCGYICTNKSHFIASPIYCLLYQIILPNFAGKITGLFTI